MVKWRASSTARFAWATFVGLSDEITTLGFDHPAGQPIIRSYAYDARRGGDDYRLQLGS
jgi:hypothetical protein